MNDEKLVRIGDLAKLTGISRSTIYEHTHRGYVFKFALAHRTTVAHYLAWLEAQSSLATNTTDEARLEDELARLRPRRQKRRKA